MAQLTFDTQSMTDQLLIDFANAMSKDIDVCAESDSLSMSESDYNSAMRVMTLQFMTLCNELTSRGLVVSDLVMCPKYI